MYMIIEPAPEFLRRTQASYISFINNMHSLQLSTLISLLLIFLSILSPTPVITKASISPPTDLSNAYSSRLDSIDNYIRRERWEDAARNIRFCLREYPASPLNAMLFTNLGICLTNMGDLTTAEEALNVALIRNPESSKALTSRALLYLLKGDNSKALEDFSSSLSIDSLQPIALQNHGLLLLSENLIENAEKDFVTLSRHFPSDPWGPAGRAEVRILQNDNESAILLLDDAIKIRDLPDFHISKISLLIEMQRFDLAKDAIREAINSHPRTGEIYLLRGVINRKFHLNEEAEIDKKIAEGYGVDPQIIDRYLPVLNKKRSKKK